MASQSSVRGSLLALVFFVLVALHPSAYAATCVGGTFIQFGINSDFEACYDSAEGGTGLFGVPTLIGSNVIFSPNAFTAESLDGAGTKTTSSTVHIRFATIGNFDFEKFVLFERGDYKLNGASSSVSVSGQLQVQDLNHFDGFRAENITTSSDLTINDNIFHNWTANATVDITAGFFNNNPTFVDMVIENQLGTFTQPGTIPSQAFIEKKFAGGSITLTVNPPETVPVPAAVWLFSSGLLGLFGLAKRKKV